MIRVPGCCQDPHGPTNKRMSWILQGRRCPVCRSPCKWLFSTRGPNPWCRRWRCKTRARWFLQPPGICLEPVNGGGNCFIEWNQSHEHSSNGEKAVHMRICPPPSLWAKKTYEMKTCSALLQTLNLMKGSCSLCSLHRYNESKAAIINFHLKASLISQSCFQEPKLATDELSSRGFCALPPGTWAEE